MTIRWLYEWPLGPLVAGFGILGCFALGGTGAAVNSTTVQGVLIDKECSVRAETRIVSYPNAHIEGGMLWAYTHARPCLLMPCLPAQRLWRIHLRNNQVS